MKLSHSVPLVLLVVAACQASTPTPCVTAPYDALLVEVSAAEQRNIAEARHECDRAKDLYAAAQAERSKAREEHATAVQEREAASVKVANAEAALRRAEQTGTSEEIASAKQVLQSARSAHAVQEAKVVLRDKQAEHAAALAEVAREHVKVAEAKVELVKAKAVNTLDRPGTQMPDVSRFEASLRRAEADESVARARSDAAQKEVAIAGTTVKERESASPR